MTMTWVCEEPSDPAAAMAVEEEDELAGCCGERIGGRERGVGIQHSCRANIPPGRQFGSVEYRNACLSSVS